jgi:hypothetical protein
MKGDAAYFARRALEERNAASNSPHPAAQRSHLEMAERYENIETAINAGKSVLKVVSREPEPPVPLSSPRRGTRAGGPASR